MSKSNITKTLEKLLENRFNTRNDFYVFECTLGWYGKEIVDCICYNCQREVICYEIKSSVSDFHSKATHTLIGNKNYYVMPRDVYNKVKSEIPRHIGVLIPIKQTYELKKKDLFEDGFEMLGVIKNASRVELKADKEVILSSMLRSMQRERLKIQRKLEKVVSKA